MHIKIPYGTLLASLINVSIVSAQATPCAGALIPSYSQPVFATGWQGNLIARGLTRPRGIQLDAQGNLLVVQQGVGIVHLRFTDAGGTCLTLAKQTTLISSSDVSSKHLYEKNPFGHRLYRPLMNCARSLLSLVVLQVLIKDQCLTWNN